MQLRFSLRSDPAYNLDGSPPETYVRPMAPTSSPALPPLYDSWMREMLGESVPSEPAATCSDCAMCTPPAAVAAGSTASGFNPDVKCCTYHPQTWNFLAGRALNDESPEGTAGRSALETRIAAGDGVTPMGLGRTRRYQLLYLAGTEGFGRALSMRCPHYIVDGGRCGIWRNRESTCATWFCKHEQGGLGAAFWERLRELLHSAEVAVARHAVLSLEVGPRALAQLFPSRERGDRSLTAAELDETATPERRAALWGAWAGREREFYQRAAELAAALSWSDIERLGGVELALQASLLRSAHGQLRDPAPPARLRVGSLNIAAGVPHDADNVVLGTYSGLNPLEVPAVLVRSLPYFDGRPTVDAVDAIEAALGVRLEDDLVRKLYAYGLLAEVEESASG